MPPTPDTPAPPTLDDFVSAFEAAWARDGAAAPDRFLPAPDHPLYLQALREVVCVDLELGWRAGRPRPLDEYLRRFPAPAADPAAPRCRARKEVPPRRHAGRAPGPARR